MIDPQIAQIFADCSESVLIGTEGICGSFLLWISRFACSALGVRRFQLQPGVPFFSQPSTLNHQLLRYCSSLIYCWKLIADGLGQRRVSVVVLGVDPPARKVQ